MSILLATYVIGKEHQAHEADLSTARANDAPRAEGAGTSASRALPELDLGRLDRTKVEETAVNLFASKNWANSPPTRAGTLTPVTPVPPPAPSAPPLPFSYVGKLMDGDKLVIFLSRKDTKYSVSAGDVIDSSYHVEQVSESGVVFTYLPLNVKQTLTINPLQ
ncbi:MAG: hypothetical protein AABZ63_06700 [Actinomycetota bacterium]